MEEKREMKSDLELSSSRTSRRNFIRTSVLAVAAALGLLQGDGHYSYMSA
jgi:hypothetical protein